MMDTRDELLPRPLCAGEALEETTEPHTHVVATFMPDSTGSTMISCPACSCAVIHEDRATAIAAWNTRAGTAYPALVEALESASTALWRHGENGLAREIDTLLDKVSPESRDKIDAALALSARGDGS